MAVRGPGGRPRESKPATAGGGVHRPGPNPAIGVSTDSAARAPTVSGVSTDPDALPGRSPGASACEPFRELIDAGLSRGRNAVSIWQGLVATAHR